MKLPGFTADFLFSVTPQTSQAVEPGSGRLTSSNSNPEMAGQIVPQLAIDLGCKAFDVCHTNCCTLTIEYTGPYGFPQTTLSCQTIETCHFGGFGGIFGGHI
jgi:hypothetical protein